MAELDGLHNGRISIYSRYMALQTRWDDEGHHTPNRSNHIQFIASPRRQSAKSVHENHLGLVAKRLYP